MTRSFVVTGAGRDRAGSEMVVCDADIGTLS
jgi:hypothetical protein